jgi:hypothetical protein
MTGISAIAHEGEGVLLLGRHRCCAWFGLKCRRVEIEDEEWFEELQRELKPRALYFREAGGRGVKRGKTYVV